jgi:two-component system, OmpR family, KDP operon response regulator KdpE
MGTFGQNGDTHAAPPLFSPSRLNPGAPSARVLLVDDEPGIRRFLRAALLNNGYDAWEASTGIDALQLVAGARPDIVILDLGLPDMHGLEIIRAVREWSQIPIIVLSVRSEEADKIAALDAGADDYLTKPFGPGELVARMRAALRRVNKPESSAVFCAGDLQVDLARRAVTVCGERVQLTPTEYDLLKTLIRYSGKIITHRQVIREVWGGASYEDEMHLLRVNVSNLRRKLERDPARPRYIITEPGVGYRLRTD